MANIQKKQQINKNIQKILNISTYHHFFQQKPSFISKYSLTLQTNRKRNPEK